MSHADLAQATGLAKSTISKLSLKSSWNGVPVDVMDSFMAACGVDLMRPSRVRNYLRTGKMRHLKAMNAHQRKFLAKTFKPVTLASV